MDCAIDGTSNVGGIADKSEGRIKNCLVSGYIKGGDDVIFGVGGIVGHGVAGNVISGCVSTADILFKYSRYAVQNGAGGIVGYTYGTVENCYLRGTSTLTQRVLALADLADLSAVRAVMLL